VGLFELDRREVAERAVEPAVVVPVDPSGGGVLDVSEAFVGPGVEDVGVDAFRRRSVLVSYRG
jgi:hypothetical protein